jgi:hypothetical protein
MSDTLKIGWAEADITPKGEVEIYGQYYPRKSKGIHSKLGATVMAMDSDNKQAVMISVDLTNFSADFLDELRENINGKVPELDVSKIIMNATHTHSAPGVNPGKSYWKASGEAEEYRALVIERISKAVGEAWNAKQTSGIINAFDFAPVGHCRRAVYTTGIAEMYGDTSRDDFIGMEGNEDSTIELLFIFDEDRKPMGAIVNVACPSQIMESTYLISSDFMGEVRGLLKEKFGESFYTLCQISAAGCQSPRDLVRMKDDELWCERGVKVIGKRIYDAVMRVYEKIDGKIDFKPYFAHSVTEIKLSKRLASYQEYIRALKELDSLEKIKPEKEAFEEFCNNVKINEGIPGRPGPYDSKLHHFVLIKNAKAVIDRYEEQQTEPYFPMELHVLRLGDIVFATSPFELYLDFGHQIKARSKANQTFIIQLACGRAAYLPTAKAEQLGGYGGLIVNGNVGSDGGKMLVDETVKEIEKLWQ